MRRLLISFFPKQYIQFSVEYCSFLNKTINKQTKQIKVVDFKHFNMIFSDINYLNNINDGGFIIFLKINTLDGGKIPFWYK